MTNATKKTTLYRYFDGEGRLLYVGITGDNTKRQSQHRRSSFWFGEIASATFEHFEHREEALEAESRAIHSERPKNNQKHGFTLEHSPKIHMMFLTGRPDGGHDDDHKLFSNLMRTGMSIFDGCYQTADQVLVACMLYANMGKTTKNMLTCSNCLQAFSSDWFVKAKAQMDALGTTPKEWRSE